MLTTITIAWGQRIEAAKRLALCLNNVPHPHVRHLLFCDVHVGMEPFLCFPLRPGMNSICDYHNYAAENLVKTEWMMKLDADCLVSPRYFWTLESLLPYVPEKGWLNGGMMMMDRSTFVDVPLSETDYWTLIQFYSKPVGSNFICRTKDYVQFVLPHVKGFIGYGWEDYLQIFLLEKMSNPNPLPGEITFENVTKRCRDEISRPKAQQLFQMNRSLALLHSFHPPVEKSERMLNENKKLLLEGIRKSMSMK